MGRRSAIKAALLALVSGGIAALIAALAIGKGAAYFDILIVAGVEALAIGVAREILLLIFDGEKRPSWAVGMHLPRSLDNSDAHELKIVLVQHLSHEKPVSIGFPPDDPEAQTFARQIATS